MYSAGISKYSVLAVRDYRDHRDYRDGLWGRERGGEALFGGLIATGFGSSPRWEAERDDRDHRDDRDGLVGDPG